MLIVAVESPPGLSLTRAVPHWEQKRASSGFALPQFVQYGIGDHLLSNPQGSVEVDGSANLSGALPRSGWLHADASDVHRIGHPPSVDWYAAASMRSSTAPASAGTSS